MTGSSSPAASTAPVSGSVEYRPAIDGLRAVAVLAVFLFHLNRKWLPGGFVGVDIFFVVSGYLIASIILRDCERNRFSFARFYQRRIARLWVAFFTVALATLFAAFFIYSDQDLASTGATLSAAAASVANLKFMWQGNYFVLSPDAQPFLHCWSLSVEEQFYLLFPAAFLLLYRKADRYRTQLLLVLCIVSFLLCIILTYTRPEWAFYLLPARGWELLAGGILATRKSKPKNNFPTALPLVGLLLIAVSFFVISENAAFPGYLDVLPVLGTVCFLFPPEGCTGIAERVLSWRPLVLIGRMSYSLYLWHWPVFSLVDYKFYSSEPLVRSALKIFISVGATAVCFVFIESPSRKFLNHPDRRRLAFAGLACSLAVLIPLGIFVRRTNYIDADMRDIKKGGLRFNESGKNGSLMLMGDSNASMYGETAKDLAKEFGLNLSVVSTAGGDPLPYSTGQQSSLWSASLAAVQKERPEFLLLVCQWSRLAEGQGRLALTLKELQPFVHVIILVTQPPELPPHATREGIRNGSRAPFVEAPEERQRRLEANQWVKSFQRDSVIVVDVEKLFLTDAGAVQFADRDGRQLYQDNDHLSAVGANRVKSELSRIIIGHKPNS